MSTFTAAVPAISTLVELTVDEDQVRNVHIDEVAGGRLTLSPPAPALVVLGVGDPVTLRWAAGDRGRYVVDGTVVDTPGSRLVVELTSEPQIEQHRRFVRGGGGEEVRMHQAASGGGMVAGWIGDISEGSVRALFAAVAIADGDPVRLTVHLDDDTIEVNGTAMRITVRPPEAPGPDATRVEVIAIFEADELQAQIIRRYVLRQQLLTRTRTAG